MIVNGKHYVDIAEGRTATTGASSLNFKHLLRLPTKKRMAEYARLLVQGKLTINDVRRNENMDPAP